MPRGERGSAKSSGGEVGSGGSAAEEAERIEFADASPLLVDIGAGFSFRLVVESDARVGVGSKSSTSWSSTGRSLPDAAAELDDLVGVAVGEVVVAAEDEEDGSAGYAYGMVDG